MPPRFVFICGLHRSGTSLLHRALRAHPMISGFENTGAPEDEGQHLQTVYPAGRAYGGPGKFCFAPEAHLTEDSPLITDANRATLLKEWGRYWDTDKPILLEKSPPNIIRSRFLQAIFPDSTFIFLLRHPIAVSMATQKWSKTDIPELLKHWAIAHRTMQEDQKYLKRFMTLRYEDWVAAPQDTLDGICRFLDIPTYALTEMPQPGHNERYFRQFAADNQTYARWREYAAMAEAFGYRLDDAMKGGG